MSRAGVSIKGLNLAFGRRNLFEDLELVVERGECVAIMGPSGSGKTTLLNVIAGIAPAPEGSVRTADAELVGRSSASRAEHRRLNVGLVFQFGELLPELTVVENAALPLLLGRTSRAHAYERAAGWLDRVGVAEHRGAWIETLSGGEVQRIGIARALINDPSVVLADEPTGNLDADNAKTVVGLLVDHCHGLGAAGVVATHDPDVASACDRVLRLARGRLDPDGVALLTAR